MKSVKITLVILFAVFAAISCNNVSDKTNVNEPDSKVIVYYFHGEQRCPTCIAVGDVSSETVKAEFPDNKDVSFMEVDYSTEDGEKIGDKYEIASSSLIIVSGETVVDLTDDAFAFAKNNPDKLKKIIIDQINKML